MYYGWKPYVPVAKRRANAARELKKMEKKLGRPAAPVHVEGRKIARTFWGCAWCDHLENHSDFDNRLPRGRTYVRNGSVIDLEISRGVVRSLVSGSDLYKIEVTIKPLAKKRWKQITASCRGKIGSLIEILQGRFSSEVMRVLSDPKEGLFPKPGEFKFDCSCPDWADMCKHVAATLYAVGARLDHEPELLFTLRDVDASDLVGDAFAAVSDQVAVGKATTLDESELADVFGIEMDAAPIAAPAKPKKKAKSKKGVAAKPKPADKKKTATRKAPAPKTRKAALPAGKAIAQPAGTKKAAKAAATKKGRKPAAPKKVPTKRRSS